MILVYSGQDATEIVDFSVAVSRADDTLVVHVTGEVDTATAPRLRDELYAATDEHGLLSVRLELAGMTFIDSSGLAVLVGSLKYLRDRGGDMTLANPRPSTLKLFEMVGLTTVFTISP